MADLTGSPQAEEALRERLQRCRNFFETAAVGMYCSKLDGSAVLEANQALCELLGCTRKEILSEPATTNWSDPKNREEMINQFNKDGIVTNYEADLITKRGEIRRCLVSAKPYPQEGYWEGTIVDITERKRVKDELLAVKSQLENMLDAIPDLMFELGLDGRYYSIHSRRTDLLVAPIDVLIGERVPDMLPLEASDVVMSAIQEAHEKGMSNGKQYELHLPQGRFWFELSISCKPVAQGQEPRFICLSRDITMRKLAEEALRESTRRYSQLMDQAADGIYVAGPEGNYLLVNSKFCEMLGYTESELLKLNVIDTYPDETKGILRQRFQRVASGEALRFERPVKRKDGTVLQAELRVSRLDDGRHQGIIHDITDRKQAEENRRKLEAKLAQAEKMEAIGTLAGGIAHDFNNILSVIVGYTELAMVDIVDPEKAMELEEILKSAGRAKDLVKHILTFSRQNEIRYSPLEIRPVIKESIKMLSSIIPTTIEIRQDLADSSQILSDPTHIHQIMMNLCSNAADAMGENGGVLKVSLHGLRINGDAEAGYPDLPPGPYVRLTVSDTGHGISPEVKDRIFDPYFTTKEKGRGTGLGLAVVHGIVERHGGSITCRSIAGAGTIFDICLPSIESHEKALQPLGPGLLPTGTERILFIDDEPSLVDVAKMTIEGLGYSVVTRTSSIEALDLFKIDPYRFDLVITDMTMPGMTGDRLAVNLMQARPNIPIILCTGYSDYITEEKAKRLGIREFVMKPFLKKDLAKTIRKVLDVKQHT